MDTIKISGIEFYAHHGVLTSEKELGQIFSIDCEFSLDTSMCTDDLGKTVNYGKVSLDIISFCQENCFDLLETLVNELSCHLLVKYNLMEQLTLTIHKPHAPIATKFSDVTLTITRSWKTCYLAIGSNLGDRENFLEMASKAIEEDHHVKGIAKSSYIETEPYGVTDQPKFLNGALKIRTIYTPLELLAFCKNIEKKAGRTVTRRWGERTLDVDIIMYGSDILFTEKLKIPHPEMHVRTFVLEPLVEIEPYLIHPIKKIDVKTLLDELQRRIV